MDHPLSATEERALHRLAELRGIQTTYVDVSGRTQKARPQTLIALLEAQGIDVSEPAEWRGLAIRAEQECVEQGLETVSVLTGTKHSVEIRLPADLDATRLAITLREESGDVKEWSCRANELRNISRLTVAGATYLRKQLALPFLPHGYHDLEVHVGRRSYSSFLICAPTESYSDDSLCRSWGIFLPMYAAHSSHSWGAGTFQDWSKLGTWVGSLGGSVVGSLPILAAFLGDEACEPSPYSPVSRFFWNEFFLDLPSIPEFQRSKVARRIANASAFQKKLQAFRRNPMVDYREEMRAKRNLLAVLAREFFQKTNSPDRNSFERFVREHPHLESYARFRATMETRRAPWQNWPERLRNGQLRSGDFDTEARDYHLFVQWQVTRQLEHVLQQMEACGVKFYLDLPLGVNPSGYDVWREQKLYALDASVGAPPDAFFTKGQDWGFAPLHPERLRKDRYRHLLEVLRFQMRHTGLLRIDHVMALRRLYWVPKGRPAAEGAYVSYPANELFALVSLESHRNKTVVVGENLGTVPPEVNERMLKHHVRQMYVVQYETQPKAKALSAPTKRVVASLNTHDMPPFAAFVSGSDITERVKLGLINKQDIPNERKNRERLVAALAKFLHKKGFSRSASANPSALLDASLKFLAASDAEMVLMNLEDLWLEKQPQNTPGTSTERPNWVRKAKFRIDQLSEHRKLVHLMNQVNKLRCAR